MVCLTFIPRFGCAAVFAPVELPQDVALVPVWASMSIIDSAGRALTTDQAADLAASHEAFTVDSPNRIVGRGMSPYWGRFAVHNPDHDQLRQLSLDTTTQFDVRLYRKDERGIWLLVPSLADQSGGRIGGGTTHPVWSLRLNAQQTAEFLLRVQGPAIVRFPVYLHSPEHFADGQRKFHLVVGAALGICLVIAGYIGSIRRYLEDQSIPLFIYMLLADLMGALWLCGFLDELLPSVPQSTLSLIGSFAYATLFGCGSLHARIYLNAAAWAPRLDRVLQGIGWGWLVLALLLSHKFPVIFRILMVWGGTATALLLVMVSIQAMRRRVPLSRFIAAAWFAYLIAGFIFLIVRVGSDPLIWSSSALILAQATLVAVLFGLAMSRRVLKQRDVLVAARQEAVMMQEKTAALVRERSLLFAATNHDLRQPLLGMGLFAELLASAPTKDERDIYALKLRQAMAEVDELIIGIQQLAAVHEGAHRLVFETVKLDDVLRPIIEEYRGRSAYKRLIIRYVPTRLTIATHVPYFQRIVRNVLSNAVRYTEQGDRIVVGCRRGGGLRLVIEDTGHGMSVEEIQRAGGAFQRFDAGLSIPDGFGLGLFSVRVLADTLGMTPSLHSKGSRGTRFILRFAPELPSGKGKADSVPIGYF